MERGWLALLALAGAAVAAAASGGELSPGSVETGKRMYRDGVRSSGAALDGRVAGDVSLRGTQSSCAGCHGRSGLGGGEGGTLVPAITAGALFRPSDAWRFDPRGPAAGSRVPRPAYDARSLAKLLREGIDPSGRPLGPLMPRYALEDDDVAHLVAYLRTLSEAPSPGVTDQSLRFATVVAGDVDPAERSAMLDVLSAFFRARNAETRGESVRRQRGSWDHAPSFDAYRHWELEVWELDGPPQSWRAELDARYEAGPVFATIAGLADGEWLPIHQFCEARELPCVLPVTRLAPERDADFYSIYFSGGVRLEANVLARHLAESGQLGRKVVQVHGDGPEMRAAARRFEEAFRAKGGRVVSHRLPSEGGAEFWTGLVLGEGPEILVAWLPAGALTGLARAAPSSSVPLFASASFCEPADVPEALVARTRLVEPCRALKMPASSPAGPTSQTSMTLVSERVITWVPSGENATPVIDPARAARVYPSAPL